MSNRPTPGWKYLVAMVSGYKSQRGMIRFADTHSANRKEQEDEVDDACWGTGESGIRLQERSARRNDGKGAYCTHCNLAQRCGRLRSLVAEHTTLENRLETRGVLHLSPRRLVRLQGRDRVIRAQCGLHRGVDWRKLARTK